MGIRREHPSKVETIGSIFCSNKLIILYHSQAMEVIKYPTGVVSL